MALTAGTWKLVEPRIGAQLITDSSTTQMHPLGTKVRARDVGTTNYGEGEFVYVKGVTSGAAKKWAVINYDDGSTTLAVANSLGPVGVMMSDLSAATVYGWVQVRGKALGQCLTQFADNGVVFLTATAGSIDDASVAGDWISGALGASAAVVGDLHAEFELQFPAASQRVSIAG